MTLAQAPDVPAKAARGSYRTTRRRARSSLFSHGEPMVWLTGGALALALFMILGLLGLVLALGLLTFWPVPVERIQTLDGRAFMGEVTRDESYRPEPHTLEVMSEDAGQYARQMLASSGGVARRWLLRTGNFELTNEDFTWVSDFEIGADASHRTEPPWAMVVERMAWGRFYGVPRAFVIDGKEVASTPPDAWAQYQAHHGPVRDRRRERRVLEKHDIGRVNQAMEDARLALRKTEMRHGKDSPQWRSQEQSTSQRAAALEGRFREIRARIEGLDRENARFGVVVVAADGKEKTIALADIVRMYPANQLSWSGKMGLYLSRWWEFLADEPREANSEGGVFPAIFGTVAMTLIMSLAVVPFGVLAALYLREYAKAGPIVSAVRIAVNNLAGVPSIVFGVFGLGFFCYVVGAGIDQAFFEAKLPNPTFGKGGLLWASFTLALLTLPVVIVATEEALAAVPNSMREGSYACGGSKWQTIRRIVLPRAMPGIMTGMILAMARGAGEVAPLMLVGAVKLAPELPLAVTPTLGVERSFMHLGFHIFDLGFQSRNSEAARPMVFTTTMLLIAIIGLLNVLAVWVRKRLRRKFMGSQF